MQSVHPTEKKIIFAGDFNLNDSKRFANDYRHRILFDKLKFAPPIYFVCLILNEGKCQPLKETNSLLEHYKVKY